MRKILVAIRYFFRERLSISSDSVATQIKDYSFSISRQEANNYHSAISINTDQSVVHPLYLTKISWHLVENLNQFLDQPINPKLLKMLVHMSQHFEIFAPLEIDEDYQVKTSLCLIEPHKKGVKLALRFEYYQGIKLVAVEHTTGLLYGVKCIGDARKLGQLPINKRRLESMIWQEDLSVDKNLPYRYADKAKIDAPIHTQPAFARSIGLPDIILQGTCTFSMAINLILQEYLEIENYSNIKTLSANFTGMLFLPNRLVVRVVYQTQNNLVFDVKDQDGNSVIKGGNIEFKSKI